jgi:hypothetical protein
MKIRFLVLAILLCLFTAALSAQTTTASITGTVSDPQQAPIPNVSVTLTNIDMGIAVRANTDVEGNYEFGFVRPGNYIIKVEHPGFRAFQQGPIKLDIDQRARVNVGLELGEATSAVNVEAGVGGVQTESSTLGTVTDTRTILEIPLNGRFILDVALLAPGTMVPSTNNRTFLAVPTSVGISGINASGTREDSTNYLLDGINLSDMVQNQITLQPNIDMVQEFKVQQSSFRAEYGRNAGIIVNAVTKAGSNAIHGSVYEFLRNQRFDAKNFFDPPGPIIPFNRNIFGYSVGAPVIKDRTFFFTSYEGRVGLEVASIKTLVPSEAQRATVTNPTIRQLLGLVPTANDPTGTFFIGSAPRNRRQDQWNGRIDHNWSPKDFIYGSFIVNNDTRAEPTLQGNNLPGFGDERPAHRYFLSLGYTRILSPNLTNELRAGLNRLRISFNPDFTQDPFTFGITSPSTVSPNVNVPGAMSFGGINGEPQGRGDTTYQYTDTIGWGRGKHSVRMGGEFRRFDNNSLNRGTGGVLTFGTMAAFLAGTPTQATQTSRPATPALRVNAFGVFVQDDYKASTRLTLNLGLRWEVAQPMVDQLSRQPNVKVTYTVPPNVANVQDPSAHPVYVRTGQGDFYEDINFRLIPYYNTPGLARPPGTLYPLQTVRDGRMGIWTDFLRGNTLEEMLSIQGPMNAREASLIGMDLCRALAAVHGAGLVHRDEHRQFLATADLEVLGAAAGRDVDDAGALVQRHLLPWNDPMVDCSARAELVERTVVAPADQLAPDVVVPQAVHTRASRLLPRLLPGGSRATSYSRTTTRSRCGRSSRIRSSSARGSTSSSVQEASHARPEDRHAQELESADGRGPGRSRRAAADARGPVRARPLPAGHGAAPSGNAQGGRRRARDGAGSRGLPAPERAREPG